MFKKLLVVAIAVASAVAIQKKVRDQRAEQELWARPRTTSARHRRSRARCR